MKLAQEKFRLFNFRKSVSFCGLFVAIGGLYDLADYEC